MSHRGTEVPLGSRYPTMAEMSCHNPATLSLYGRACLWVPDVPLGSGCPTTIQMYLRDPSMLSPSIHAVQLCSDHAAIIHP